MDIATKQKRKITKGEWEVFDILGVNEGTGDIYYTGNESGVRE